MANAHEAADLIRAAARQYRAFQEAANILDNIGSLEQAVVAATVERDAALADAAKAKAELSRAKIKAAEILANAELEVATMLEAAVATAGATADQLIHDAAKRAEAMIAAAAAAKPKPKLK